MTSQRSCLLALVGAGVAWLPAAIHAQIVTDGTVGAAQTLVGPNYTIPQTLGTVSGDNLFHSFTSFNINAGQTANFTTTTASLDNVISRVTGGSVSNINGQLRLQALSGGSPDFWFINPAGVVFGAGASINVPGAFHVGTADYIAFPDGDFSATTPSGSTLSAAAPEAFGFLGTQSNDLVVNNNATLSLNNGSTLALAGGDITIDNATVSNFNGGDIEVTAVGTTVAEVPVGGSLPNTNGTLTVSEEGQIYTETNGAADAGDVTVMAGDITVDDKSDTSGGTAISTGNTSGSTGGSGGAVTVTATDTLTLRDGGQIAATTNASGDSGTITINADTLSIDNVDSGSWYTGALTNSYGSGDAQDITIDVSGRVTVLNAGEISTNVRNTGDAGWVNITADELYIDGQGSPWVTSIGSIVHSGGSGDASGVYMDISSDIWVYDGAEIRSSTWGNGDAGIVYIETGNLLVDRWSNSIVTGIHSNAESSSTGDAGIVYIDASGDIDVLNGAEIGTNTFASGDAGYVSIEGDDITLDGQGSSNFTGIASNADNGSSGTAGQVSITANGTLEIRDGSEIGSNTFGSGNAGQVVVNAADLLIDRDGSSSFTGIASETAASSLGDGGSVSVTVDNTLTLEDGGQITSNTYGVGDAGAVTVNTQDLMIDGQGSSNFTGLGSTAEIGSSGHAGTISVTASGDVTIQDGGGIISDTWENGNAGSVSLDADTLTIDGMGSSLFTGIGTNAKSGSTGDAGFLFLSITNAITMDDGAQISSNTNGAGDAGYIGVDAASLDADGGSSSQLTGIITLADTASSGDAGYLDIDIDDIRLTNGAVISSDTRSSGDAGYVDVDAVNVYVEGENIFGDAGGITSNTRGTGTAGGVSLTVDDTLTLIGGGVVSSDNWSNGDAGAVVVSAGNIFIDDRGSSSTWTGISSDTVGTTGDAGYVSVTASGNVNLVNDGAISSATYGTGDAGYVEVSAGNLSLRDGAAIGSDNTSTGTGDAGYVNVSASNITIDASNGDWTGISSDAVGAVGDAGDVAVSASNTLSMLNGGVISSDTYDSGIAGDVTVNAGTINMQSGSDISAQARTGSSGQTGNVNVTATNQLLMSGDAEISIANRATVATPSLLTPTTLTVTAPSITLDNADITARSTGNVDASNIIVNAGNSLIMRAVSGITTSANDGNGGAISIVSGNLVRLNDSQISTSVTGLTGDGGNINLSADTLILNTGFIQANTAAANASGGDVSINVDTLLASLNTLHVGGRNAFTFQPGVPGFNVIQAAAPTGVSGVVSISTPLVDLSASLRGLNAALVDSGGLGRSPCAVGGGSSLAAAGHGGLPPSASGLARADGGAASNGNAGGISNAGHRVSVQLASAHSPDRMPECVPL